MRTLLRRLRRALRQSTPSERPRTAKPCLESLEDREVLATGVSVNQNFVASAYEHLLQRPADPGGLAFFSGLLDQGVATRLQVVMALESNNEYRTIAVRAAYDQFLHRDADTLGLNFFTNAMAQGATTKQVKIALAASQEFFAAAGGTNAGFLNALYQAALNRSVDASGSATFSTALNAGISRATVAQVILASPEATAIVVQKLYSQILNRAADQAGLAAFVAIMDDPVTGTTGATSGATTTTTTTTNGSASQQRNLTNTSGSASQQRNLTTGTGTTGSTTGTTTGSTGSTTGTTGATTGATTTNGSASQQRSLANNTGSASQQRNVQMTPEQAAATLAASQEFFNQSQGTGG